MGRINNERTKKIRRMHHIIRYVLGVFFMLGTAIGILTASVWLGSSSQKMMQQAVQKSGYYKAAYEEFCETLESNSENQEIAKKELRQRIPYGTYYRAAQKLTARALDHRDDMEQGIQEIVEKTITKKSFGENYELIQVSYGRALRIPVMEVIGSNQKKISGWCWKILVLCLIVIAACIIGLHKQYSSSYRAIRQIGYNLFTGGVLAILIGLTLKANMSLTQEYVQPRYEKLLEALIHGWSSQLYLIAFLIILASVGCFLIADVMKRR